jgi:hypothetical protein
MSLRHEAASARDEIITIERAPAIAKHFKAVAIFISTSPFDVCGR